MNQLDSLMQRQIALELDMVNQGVHRYHSDYSRAMGKQAFGETYPGTLLTKIAIEPLADAIVQWREEALGGGAGRRHRAAILLRDMDPTGVSFVAIRTILSQVHRRNSLASLALRVGKAVMDEARFQAFEQEAPGLYRTVNQTAARNAADNERRRVTLIYSMNKFEVSFNEWSKNDRLHLGVKIIELFVGVSGFVQIVKDRSDKKRGFIHRVVPTEELLQFITDRNAIGEIMRPRYLPMLVPPNPWDSPEGSPYFVENLQNRTMLVSQRADNSVDFPTSPNMPLVYRGVNAIQSTPWRVNRRVFNVLSTLWDRNLPVPGIPSRENLKIRPYPDDPTDEEKIAWRMEARRIHDANAKSQGTRLQVSMSINTAQHFLGEEQIFFPHHLDFRGRCYPIPAVFSPQGADYSRSLLEFAKGKPLGDWKAARWLAIHGANVYGYDRVDLDERVQWTFDHEEEILWCAEDPLKFDWWHQADKPFSFLAFCFEWQGYKRSGLDHVTRLPIALDGTCNGIQHFSAMLRDSVGGASVNLLPADKPQRIYRDVAERVVEMLKAGPWTGKEKLWAETWLAVGVDDTITKRPVMVMPYGGTFRSCIRYVSEKAAEKLQKAGGDPFGEDSVQAHIFLARAVWDALGASVVAARDAMSWLQKVARVTTKAGLDLEWTTPVGFPVRQRYLSTEARRVKTQLFGAITYLSYKEELADEVAVAKQANAMSPNFVHSLDSAAMMLTIDAALDEGITDFAMIHDSYGTLATDTDRLSRLIRESFVRMYREHDVLEELRQDILERLPEEARKDIPPVPPKGNLIIDDVLRSEFFFS